MACLGARCATAKATIKGPTTFGFGHPESCITVSWEPVRVEAFEGTTPCSYACLSERWSRLECNEWNAPPAAMSFFRVRWPQSRATPYRYRSENLVELRVEYRAADGPLPCLPLAATSPVRTNLAARWLAVRHPISYSCACTSNIAVDADAEMARACL